MRYLFYSLSTWFTIGSLEKPVNCAEWKLFKLFDGSIVAKLTKNGVDQVDVLRKSDILSYFNVNVDVVKQLESSLNIIGNNSTQVDIKVGPRLSHSGYGFLTRKSGLILQSTSRERVVLEDGVVICHPSYFQCLDPRVLPSKQYQLVLEVLKGGDVQIMPSTGFKQYSANNFIYQGNLRSSMQYQIYRQLYGDRFWHLSQGDGGLHRHSSDVAYNLCQKYMDKGFIEKKMFTEELLYYKYLKNNNLLFKLEGLMAVNSLLTDNKYTNITAALIREDGGFITFYNIAGDTKKNEEFAYKSWQLLNNLNEI